MKIIQYRKFFYMFSGGLILAATLAIAVFGLRPSIDFSGGELFVVGSKQGMAQSKLSQDLKQLKIEKASIRSTNLKGYKTAYSIRTKSLGNSVRKDLLQVFSKEGIKVERMSFVGPIIGAELKKKAVVAIVLTVLAIIAFIAWAFREVSRPVSSWKYGAVAIIALIHDVLIPVAVFAVLGKFMGAEIDTLFIMALLAILGYSVNDTIVIFDRVRERLKRNKDKKRKESFDETVGHALDSTIVRSINTSVTTAVVLVALYILGAQSTHYFALTLLAGVIAGTYSSIFLAAPLLVDIAKFSARQK